MNRSYASSGGLLDAFPYIRIPGEEESESISREVNHVIQYRVEQLSKDKGLSSRVKDHLAKKLLGIPHRTYLWVYLVFDYFKTEHFKKTPNGIDATFATLPKNIDQAYEQILNKSKEHPVVRRALSIILAASRPLTLSEMNVALNIDETSRSINDLDLEEEEDFKLRLRSWCGLFVSIHHNKIYLLHQTAREFLLSDLPSSVAVTSKLHWQHSITSRGAHEVLAEVCVAYLNFLNSDDIPTVASGETGQGLQRYTFLDYSAKNWGLHFLEARISKDARIVPPTLRICDPDLRSCSTWFKIYWNSRWQKTLEHLTSLMISSYFGHEALVRLQLEKGAAVESKDDDGRTPLSWAARNGHEIVVTLLLEKAANVGSRGNDGRTPLSWAALKGHEAVVKLLLEKGGDVESKGNDGRTPLSWAALNGHEAVVQLLLEKGADVESKDHDSRTPLSWAALNGHGAVVKLLLEKGAAESKDDKGGRTPLWWAVEKGTRRLSSCCSKRVPMSSQKATIAGRFCRMLHDMGTRRLSSYCSTGSSTSNQKTTTMAETPLSWAAEYGHEAVVQLLLEGCRCRVKKQ